MTMLQEYREQLIKDLFSYLPDNAKIALVTIDGVIDLDIHNAHILFDHVSALSIEITFLRLASMTEEERKK